MTEIKNFSRHPFNADQKRALRYLGYEPEDGARAPFFKGAQDFVDQVGGSVASAVVPGDIMRDCWAGEAEIPEGTVFVGWITDWAARERKRFAVRGYVVHEWKSTLSGGTSPRKTDTGDIVPTVENDFQTGEEFPYAG